MSGNELFLAFDQVHWQESVKILEYVLSTGDGWHYYDLDFRNDHTKLLLHLLHSGKIKLYEHIYPYIPDFSSETIKRANIFRSLMRKRNTSQALFVMAEIFPQDHDVNQTLNNAVYFPVHKAYIRCEGLKPINLLQLFGSDACCDRVIVFPGYWEPTEKIRFYSFVRVISKDSFLNIMESFSKIIFERDSAIIRNLTYDKIFPDVSDT